MDVVFQVVTFNIESSFLHITNTMVQENDKMSVKLEDITHLISRAACNNDRFRDTRLNQEKLMMPEYVDQTR
jgi:hypothetical protein